MGISYVVLPFKYKVALAEGQCLEEVGKLGVKLPIGNSWQFNN